MRRQEIPGPRQRRCSRFVTGEHQGDDFVADVVNVERCARSSRLGQQERHDVAAAHCPTLRDDRRDNAFEFAAFAAEQQARAIRKASPVRQDERLAYG